MKTLKLILIFSFAVLLSSCGSLLQKTAFKNYNFQTKISSKGLNDFQYDFVYLTKLLDEGFPKIDSVFPVNERLKLQNEIMQKLSNPKLEKKDFVIQCMKYLSRFHSQHTNIHSKSVVFKKAYPFVIFISKNNWYLLNIENTKDSLLIGKQILTINNMEVSTIENQLSNYAFAENKINQQSEIMNMQSYNKPEILKDIGLISSLNDSIKITFQNNSSVYLHPEYIDSIAIYKIKLSPNRITKYVDKTYFYKIYPKRDFAYLQYNSCQDKIAILDGIDDYIRPWMRPLVRLYLEWQFHKKKPSKLLAPYYNPEYPIFKDFVWELVDSLNNRHIDNLIIDLRNNPGGDRVLGIQLLYFLTDRKDLKNFKEYTYTSKIYKNYYKEEFRKLKRDYFQKFGKPVPDNELIPTNLKGDNLFTKIIDKKSVYYISPNRPVFKGNVFILANYGTESAAALLTILAQDNKIATIIGTSVGNNPIGATTWTPFKLPKTKTKVSIALTYMERPNKKLGRIQIPDYWVEYSVDDLLKGKDPFLEKVIELINSERRYKER